MGKSQRPRSAENLAARGRPMGLLDLIVPQDASDIAPPDGAVVRRDARFAAFSPSGQKGDPTHIHRGLSGERNAQALQRRETQKARTAP